MSNNKTPVVVVPNWNGEDSISACLDSLTRQTLQSHIIVVDNGSVDGSVSLIEGLFPDVQIIKLDKNYGFAGGVNTGIREAMSQNSDYVALFNNDAVAEKNWLKHLVAKLNENPGCGIATGKFMGDDKKHLDSTGDTYTSWGLPFPRGRGESISDKYDDETLVFGASGGASLYRTKLFKEIGLFDENFFAYYEDVDISFRAQLAGWKVSYCPSAIAYHATGTTSSKIKGFTTYQTMKNLPWLLWKNVPLRLLYKVVPRFSLAYVAFALSAIQRGQGWYALKGGVVSLVFLPKKIWQRWGIQSSRKVSVEYVTSIMVWDLPSNATKLRNLRTKWWRVRGKI